MLGLSCICLPACLSVFLCLFLSAHTGQRHWIWSEALREARSWGLPRPQGYHLQEHHAERGASCPRRQGWVWDPWTDRKEGAERLPVGNDPRRRDPQNPGVGCDWLGQLLGSF